MASSRFPRMIVVLIALPVFLIVMLVNQDTASTINAINDYAKATISDRWTVHPLLPLRAAAENDSSRNRNNIPDKLLDGLLSPNFDEKSCLSWYQIASYRKPSPSKPSLYLISKLRSYEERHKRCGPYTKSYNRTIESLKSGQADTSDECKYMVWTASGGIGNRLLTMVGTFIYALLTDRVLLINQDDDMVDLFCEPVPGSSWILPSDFPFEHEIRRLGPRDPHTLGNMLRHNMINASTESLSYLYIYLQHDYSPLDQRFFCDDYQSLLRKVPWLILKSNLYFVPSLFLMDSFEEELTKLFPDKETIFHHLGRYLFHPSNTVWEVINKYYQDNLADAEERIGLQIRIFNKQNSPLQAVMDQILSCVQREKLLPEVDMGQNASTSISETTRVSKAILVISLYADYYEKLKNIYGEHKTKNGEVLGIYQPSHEQQQKFDNNLHNIQAWAEINLLSFSDMLMTSAQSTFGYVSQSLGGIKPYVLYLRNDKTMPEPSCGRVMSMEPCFHTLPMWNCKKKSKVDIATIAPYVKHCEDLNWGSKLFNTYQ